MAKKPRAMQSKRQAGCRCGASQARRAEQRSQVDLHCALQRSALCRFFRFMLSFIATITSPHHHNHGHHHLGDAPHHNHNHCHLLTRCNSLLLSAALGQRCKCALRHVQRAAGCSMPPPPPPPTTIATFGSMFNEPTTFPTQNNIHTPALDMH